MSYLRDFKNTHTSKKLKLGKKILFSLTAISLFFFIGQGYFPITAQAAKMPSIIGHEDATGEGILLPGPESGDPKAAQKYVNDNLLTGITNNIFIFMLAISVGAIIVAGILYVLSMGDSEKLKRAKDIIQWTIVGIVIAALSYTAVSILVHTEFFN